MTSESEGQQRGLMALAAITGGTGTAVVESLKDIAPDVAREVFRERGVTVGA